MQAKAFIISSAFLLVLALTLPLLSDSHKTREEPLRETEKIEPSSEPDPAMLTYSPTVETSPLPKGEKDSSLIIKVLIDDEVVELTMYEHLVGVVAAEMPASFEAEALKAQAVAARTYTLYRMLEEPSARHTQADVCSDVTCCKAYISTEVRKEKWGENFEEYSAKIENAVAETDGICLVYEDRPIFAAFHSSSAGYTENSENVFNKSLPYLQSVFSPETEEVVPNYITNVEIAFSDFRETVKAAYGEAVFTDNPEDWITDVERSFCGRIVSLKVGGVCLTGTEFRFLFSLRSAAIDIACKENSFELTVTGYGHGVGMSQYGANALAAGGSGFEEILKWYYTDAITADMGYLF